MVERELEAARSAHPAQNSFHEGYAVLLEEVEEAWALVKTRGLKRDAGLRYNLLEELVQVAAMAQRMAEDNGLIPECTPPSDAGLDIGARVVAMEAVKQRRGAA